METLNKVFALRGLLAFLAFIEFVNCSRSLLPRWETRKQKRISLKPIFPLSLFTLPHERVSESFIQNKIFNLTDLSSDVQHLVGTLFGFYSLLNSVNKWREMEKSIDIEVFLFNSNFPGCSHPLSHTATSPAYLQSCLPDAEPQDNIPGELSESHLLTHHPSPADHSNLGWPHISLYLKLHQ